MCCSFMSDHRLEKPCVGICMYIQHEWSRCLQVTLINILEISLINWLVTFLSVPFGLTPHRLLEKLFLRIEHSHKDGTRRVATIGIYPPSSFCFIKKKKSCFQLSNSFMQHFWVTKSFLFPQSTEQQKSLEENDWLVWFNVVLFPDAVQRSWYRLK